MQLKVQRVGYTGKENFWHVSRGRKKVPIDHHLTATGLMCGDLSCVDSAQHAESRVKTTLTVGMENLQWMIKNRSSRPCDSNQVVMIETGKTLLAKRTTKGSAILQPWHAWIVGSSNKFYLNRCNLNRRTSCICICIPLRSSLLAPRPTPRPTRPNRPNRPTRPPPLSFMSPLASMRPSLLGASDIVDRIVFYFGYNP
eukprot:767718-Hanusia_phi.AAC.3